MDPPLVIQFGSDFIFVFGLMAIGAWLETINGRHGFADDLLTPFPLGLLGMAMIVGKTIVA
jgi:hypothetical protein